jgi:putative membrane protein
MAKNLHPLGIALRGFAMGCADIVPGVSGGTVALVTGIYDRLVGAVTSVVRALPSLFRLQFRKGWETVDTGLILPLGIGLVIAIATMAHLITSAMTHQPELTWGLFLGLMIGSLLVVGRMTQTKSFLHWGMALVSAHLAWVITISTPVETQATPLNFFLSGSVAIAAMILPGISGSFLLLIMGKYLQVIGALKACLSAVKELISSTDSYALDPLASLWQHGVMEILPFILGCAFGLGCFSWILQWFLRHHRDAMICCLAGLMAGSIHKLWPFRETTIYLHREGKPDKILQDMAVMPYWEEPTHLGAMALILIGFVAVISFERIARNKN